MGANGIIFFQPLKCDPPGFIKRTEQICIQHVFSIRTVEALYKPILSGFARLNKMNPNRMSPCHIIARCLNCRRSKCFLFDHPSNYCNNVYVVLFDCYVRPKLTYQYIFIANCYDGGIPLVILDQCCQKKASLYIMI